MRTGPFARSAEFRKIVDNIIETHDGGFSHRHGDSVLAEFAARWRRCAPRSISEAARSRNLLQPRDRQLRYRIGINLGDVLVRGNDLLGDGVNVAARLESLAEPGGICVSGTVWDQVTTNYRSAMSISANNRSKHPAPDPRLSSARRRRPGTANSRCRRPGQSRASRSASPPAAYRRRRHRRRGAWPAALAEGRPARTSGGRATSTPSPARPHPAGRARSGAAGAGCHPARADTGSGRSSQTRARAATDHGAKCGLRPAADLPRLPELPGDGGRPGRQLPDGGAAGRERALQRVVNEANHDQPQHGLPRRSRWPSSTTSGFPAFAAPEFPPRPGARRLSAAHGSRSRTRPGQSVPNRPHWRMHNSTEIGAYLAYLNT